MDLAVPLILEKILEIIQLVPLERIRDHIVEHIGGVPVPQIKEDIVQNLVGEQIVACACAPDSRMTVLQHRAGARAESRRRSRSLMCLCPRFMEAPVDVVLARSFRSAC